MKAVLLTNSNGAVIKVVLVLFMALVAFVFGLLAASANPLLIGLGVGVVAGAMLLAVPGIAIEILFTLGLLMGALISFAGSAFGKLPWALSLLGMLLLLPACLSMFKARQPALPGFVWLALVFMVYAVVVTALHWNSVAESVAGFKRYFQVFGLLFALALLTFTDQHWKRWQKMLLGIALLQFPFALYELLVLVPQRGGLALSSYTTDVVAGTFGASLEGGSPGIIMVVFLLIVSSFLFSRWRSGLISGYKALQLAFFLLLPLVMGENKVVIVLFPMVWLVLVRHDVVRSPAKYFPVLILGLLLTSVMGYVYTVLIMNSNVQDVVQSTIDYNFANGGYGSLFLNRTTVLSFWFGQQGLHNPLGFFFGNGLGSSFFGEVSGHIGIRYPHHGIDLTTASTLLWDLGIIGLVLFAAIFVGAWHTAGKIYRASQDAETRADCIAIQAAISLFLVLFNYAQVMVNLIAMEIIYSLVLGYLTYLYSRHIALVKKGLV